MEIWNSAKLVQSVSEKGAKNIISDKTVANG